MLLSEAQQIASKVKRIPEIAVVGVKTIEGDEKALILRINRRRVAVKESENALGRIAKAADIHGHHFVQLDLCSLCFRTLSVSADGHYHETASQVVLGVAEPVCCKCLFRANGKKCTDTSGPARRR